MVSIPTEERMICEIKVVHSFFHLWYLPHHVNSVGKLLFTD